MSFIISRNFTDDESSEDDELRPHILRSPLIDHQQRLDEARRNLIHLTVPPQHRYISPSDSSNYDWSSPLVGTATARAQHARQKAGRLLAARRAKEKYEIELREEAEVEADLDEVLLLLQKKERTFGQLMKYVFNPEKGQGYFRHHGFFINSGATTEILNYWNSSQNRSKFAREELGAWAVSYVAGLVSRESKKVTISRKLQTMGKVVDDELVSSFNLADIHQMLAADSMAPVSLRLLTAMATSQSREIKHTKRRKERAQIVITSSALACLGEYSHANNLSKRMIGLYMYGSGAQRQALSVLSTLGLSESYTNMISKNIRKPRALKVAEEPVTPTQRETNHADEIDAQEDIEKPTHYTGTLRQLSESMRRKAREIAMDGRYGLVYDNINMNLRSAEQVIGRHDTQENGTCATVFPLYNVNQIEDIQTKDLQSSFMSAPNLRIEDILHTPEESKLFKKNLTYALLRIFVRYGGEGFRKFEKDLEKGQPQSKHKIKLHRTSLHPLITIEVDEASIIGNAEVDRTYVKELGVDKIPEFWERVRFVGGDQLSLARLRSLEGIRAGQEENYEGYFHFALMPGLFHAKMADALGTLMTHWGDPNAGSQDPASLAFANTRLDRLPITLSSPPSYRVIRDLIFVNLYARSLHCLLKVSGTKSIDDYLTRHTTNWWALEDDAYKILTTYANANVVEDLRWKRSRSESKETEGGKAKITNGDMVFENAVLFMRDALISREFADAVKAGDSGRVILVLKVWALSFRGNGRTKYAYEMLHVIHNMTSIFPRKIHDIILDNWLLNPTGDPNSWVELDLVQEHLNFWIKEFYKAHGANASWEWLEMISPCVEVLRKLARNFNDILGADMGKRHAPPDLTNDIETLMDSLEDHNVFSVQKGRVLGGEGKPVPDVIAVGLHNLTDPDGSKNPLTDYNKAFTRLKRRRGMTPVALPTATSTASVTPQTMTSLGQQPAADDRNTSTTSQVVVQNTQSIGGEGETESLVENETEHAEEIEPTDDDVQLPCLTAADVAFDMDEDPITDSDEYMSDSEVSEHSEMEEKDEGEGDYDDTCIS